MNAKIVKVTGLFIAYYAPTYRDPYKFNSEFKVFVDTFRMSPLVGPSLERAGQNLYGDLELLCRRMTISAVMPKSDEGTKVEESRWTCDWQIASDNLKWAIQQALEKPMSSTRSFGYTYLSKDGEYKEYETIKVEPLAQVPEIVAESLLIFGSMATQLRDAVLKI